MNDAENLLVEEKGSRKRLGLLLLIPLLATVLVTYFFAMQWKDGLLIDQVMVDGTHILTPQQIVTLADVQPHALEFEQNMFVAEKKIAMHPMIKSAAVNRELPNSVLIHIVEREPIAALSGSQLYCVDAEGVLLPREPATVPFDLPIISGIGGIDTLTPGTAIRDTDLTEALEILQDAQLIGFYKSISEVSMKPGTDPTIYSAENAVPMFFGRGNIGKKMLMLQTFWNGAVNPGNISQIQYVDARFEGQVVVKWAQKAQATKVQL